MKRLSLLLLWAFLVAGCAMHAYVPVETTEVVSIEGKNQRELYNKTRQWFSQYFVSGESVIDYEDPSTGTIIGNGVAGIGTDPLGLIRYRIHYNIRIDTKDGKFRVVTKIIKHTNTDSTSTYNVGHITEERNKKALAHVATLVEDIKKYVTDAKLDSSW
jgi:hypothetical protein